MKKTFILEDLDCAHCAAKIETAVKAINGVNDAVVNFMTTKMIIDADEDKMEAVVEEAKKVVKKTDSDVTVKEA